MKAKQACCVTALLRNTLFAPNSLAFHTSKNRRVKSPLCKFSTSNRHVYLDPNNHYLQRIKKQKCEHDTNQQILPTSKPGLDPATNRFHQPIVFHPNYSSPWPENHTFPMSKFYHTAQILIQKQPHLPRPLVRTKNDFFMPLETDAIPKAWIAQPHGPIDEDFLESFLTSSLTYEECRRIGFRELCHTPELIQRTLLEVSGTILSSHLAYAYGLATNVAGGTHHATATMGAGYTILNDLAISSKYILDRDLNGGFIDNVNRVLVIDCDVHQGDGTASFDLFPNEEKNMFTLSIHCESNYPRYKANSTYDIGLSDDMGDSEYLKILQESVNKAIRDIQPDFVFYDAGVDVYQHDVLGRLNISENGIRQRDRWVIEKCVKSGIPVVGVIGGGYDKDLVALGRRHAILHEEAAYVWRKYKMWTMSSTSTTLP